MRLRPKHADPVQQVDHAVRQALSNGSAPLLLAGIAYLLPIYREANTYPQLIEEDITVNPDDLPLNELHAQAWAIVAPRFGHTCAAAVEHYTDAARYDAGIGDKLPANNHSRRL